MTTNRAVRILLGAVLIAVAITAVKWYAYYQATPVAGLRVRCFEEGPGWGYDIMAGGKVVIHQPIDPDLAGRQSFGSREAAADHARIVINKIKLGETPVFGAPAKQRTGGLPAHKQDD
ncbi:DUF4907 domain-containing protein [Paraflavitalea pollutisoli]|uniref:DUF4907 domain-containing protein n=1 Tax=Paraflavitalea pollutisoli TaxID=3034143 RepID=UPI0023EAB356|nr:DUF4907 domain-containing protein [Paraflavitalea sp. H1-2-19X]